MIQIAICDDEKEILDEVSGYIKNYGTATSALRPIVVTILPK